MLDRVHVRTLTHLVPMMNEAGAIYCNEWRAVRLRPALQTPVFCLNNNVLHQDPAVRWIMIIQANFTVSRPAFPYH